MLSLQCLPFHWDLSSLGTLFAEVHEITSIDRKYLNAVVILVSDDSTVHSINAHTCRTIELAMKFPADAELVVELAVRCVHLKQASNQ